MDADLIELLGVRASGNHGVLASERSEGQDFLVDVRMQVSTRAAARSDDLRRTVNYAEVAASVVAEIEGEPRDLIETVAESIAERILAEQILVRSLEVTLHKPAAPIPHPFADVQIRIRRDAPAVPAVLAVGSNLGDREEHLRRALELITEAPGVEVLWTGPVVETDPVGGVEQQPFLNSTIGLSTSLDPWMLLDLAHHIEQDAHRTRTLRWGPRTLDVDVITYGDLIQPHEDLTLPHPRAGQRAFVLAPWAASRPRDEMPGGGPILDLLAAASDREGVRPGPRILGYDRGAEG